MRQQLIDLSLDLKRLRDEGYEISIVDNHLVVGSVPYLDASGSIQIGTLVSTLEVSGIRTNKPRQHVIHFVGSYPCDKSGKAISGIHHQSGRKKLSNNITVDHSFSNKPKGGYSDYYQKVTRYIEMISSHASSLDPTVTARTFTVIESPDDPVFNYMDSNSSRSGIQTVSSKLEEQKIAIIGLGGTGAYILDFVSKTRVSEIHLFDGDEFFHHNAFRYPGAAGIEDLNSRMKKVDYLKGIYSVMRKGIVPHGVYVGTDQLKDLDPMSFVFISIDNDVSRKTIAEYLVKKSIPFIDVGIGLQVVNEELIGQIRTTACSQDKNDHLPARLPMASEVNDDPYSTNIQIAELNAMNASMAVIKWKKMSGFYQDQANEFNSVYAMNTGDMINDEHPA